MIRGRLVGGGRGRSSTSATFDVDGAALLLLSSFKSPCCPGFKRRGKGGPTRDSKRPPVLATSDSTGAYGRNSPSYSGNK